MFESEGIQSQALVKLNFYYVLVVRLGISLCWVYFDNRKKQNFVICNNFVKKSIDTTNFNEKIL